jgi:hypothetical protein
VPSVWHWSGQVDGSRLRFITSFATVADTWVGFCLIQIAFSLDGVIMQRHRVQRDGYGDIVAEGAARICSMGPRSLTPQAIVAIAVSGLSSETLSRKRFGLGEFR